MCWISSLARERSGRSAKRRVAARVAAFGAEGRADRDHAVFICVAPVIGDALAQVADGRHVVAAIPVCGASVVAPTVARRGMAAAFVLGTPAGRRIGRLRLTARGLAAGRPAGGAERRANWTCARLSLAAIGVAGAPDRHAAGRLATARSPLGTKRGADRDEAGLVDLAIGVARAAPGLGVLLAARLFTTARAALGAKRRTGRDHAPRPLTAVGIGAALGDPARRAYVIAAVSNLAALLVAPASAVRLAAACGAIGS